MAAETRHPRHALVFGASGINGWALVNQLLNEKPSPRTFSRITAVLNRPLPLEDSQWPLPDENFQAVSGIDLTADVAGLEKALRDNVRGVETISHVYYAAYRQSDIPADECRINARMLHAAVHALEKISPSLSFVVLITGTKAYGIHLMSEFPYRNDVPLSEKLSRVAPEYAKDIFYYHQVDVLKDLSKGKSWDWCEVRPDVIVGLAPIGNAHCMAQTMGIYLSLYAAVEGRGAEVSFPGSQAAYGLLSNDSSQDIIAKFCIYASLHPGETSAQAFNIADCAQPCSWITRWPILAEYFGLKGTAPSESALHPTEYVRRHQAQLDEFCRVNHLKTDVISATMQNPGSRMIAIKVFDFDRTLDLRAARTLGFEEEVETKSAWYLAFDRMKKARLIP